MQAVETIHLTPDAVRDIASLIQSAGLAMESGRPADAIRDLTAALDRAPFFSHARDILINCLIEQGREDEALEQHDLMARILHAGGKPADAIEDADQLYRIGLRLKLQYGGGPQTAISHRLVERAMAYFRRACAERLDLSYFGGQTMCEIGYQDFGMELFDFGVRQRQRMREELDGGASRLRFLYGDFSVSANVPGVPNLLTGIGHICFMDYYVKLIRLGWAGDVEPVMLLKDSPVVNRYLLDLFRPYVRIVEDDETIARLRPLAVAYEEILNSQVQVQGRWTFSVNAYTAAQGEWERQGRAPLLSIPEADAEEGWKRLETLGPKRGDWFVCVHVRDNGYRREVEAAPENRGLPNLNNANIGLFQSAVDAIIERGGWVLRMGGPEMCDLPFRRDRFIDYAHSDVRSEFMDIFLVAKCRFFLGTSSGLACVPRCFGVPAAQTNLTPAIARSTPELDIALPKITRRKSDGAALGFLDAYAVPYGRSFRPEILDSFGLEVEDNTEAEILELVLEMLDRLDGKDAGDTPDVAELRRKYDSLGDLAGVRDGGYGVRGRVGRAFLRRHAHLLDDVP